MQNIKSKKIVVIIMAMLISTSACTNSRGEIQYTKTLGLAGAAVGLGVGQLIAVETDGTLIGGAIGLLAGVGVGAYMDAQNDELQEVAKPTEVCVEKVQNNIILVMPNNITFATDSATINSDFARTLKSVASIINKYEKTSIEISGFTDNVGDSMYNKALSQRRANAVAEFLITQGVDRSRLVAKGYGESMPIMSNETPEGRAMNRRVELKIRPIDSKF